MPYHKPGGYDQFDAVAEAKEHYRRVRNPKARHFILSDTGVDADKPVCAHCGKPIDTKNGNRCQYFPRTKKVAVMHYLCAWENVLGHIFENTRLI